MYSSTEQLETVWDSHELTTVNQIRVRQSIQDRSSSLYAPPIQVYLVYQRNVCVLFNPVDALYLKGTRTRCDKLSPIQQEEVQFACLHVTTQDSLGMGHLFNTGIHLLLCTGECCCVWTTLQCKIHHHFKRKSSRFWTNHHLFSQSLCDTRSFSLFYGEFVTGWAVNSPRPVPLSFSWPSCGRFLWVQLHHETFISSVVLRM